MLPTVDLLNAAELPDGEYMFYYHGERVTVKKASGVITLVHLDWQAEYRLTDASRAQPGTDRPS